MCVDWQYIKRVRRHCVSYPKTQATDWLPTLAGLAGVPATTNFALDGVDQTPMLEGNAEPGSVRDTIIHNASGVHSLLLWPYFHRGDVTRV